MKRIGVFVCHCGINIASTVDTEKVVEELKKHPSVAYATSYLYMCSDPGQEIIHKAIEEHKLDGVIIAACSPTLHQNTFRKLIARAGLNYYQHESANIREQCSWVHRNREEATAKAVKIVRSNVEKLAGDEDLEPISVPVTRKALVIGAGIAGIQAALDIANAGHEVVLVEREPSIGGHMAQLSETFPTLDCSQCIMTPRMVEVAQHPNIKLMSYSEVDEVSGFIGNFKARIKKKAAYLDREKCTGCRICVEACPTRYEISLPAPPALPELTEEEKKTVEEILSRYDNEKSAVIAILQDVSAEYNYLPRHILEYLAHRLEVPLTDVLHLATFFRAFSLEPRGKHLVTVCVGTACHVRGAGKVLDRLERELGICAGETTTDLQFTLESVNCLGACALGPVVVTDGEYHGEMTPGKAAKVLNEYYERSQK